MTPIITRGPLAKTFSSPSNPTQNSTIVTLAQKTLQAGFDKITDYPLTSKNITQATLAIASIVSYVFFGTIAATIGPLAASILPLSFLTAAGFISWQSYPTLAQDTSLKIPEKEKSSITQEQITQKYIELVKKTNTYIEQAFLYTLTTTLELDKKFEYQEQDYKDFIESIEFFQKQKVTNFPSLESIQEFMNLLENAKFKYTIPSSREITKRIYEEAFLNEIHDFNKKKEQMEQAHARHPKSIIRDLSLKPSLASLERSHKLNMAYLQKQQKNVFAGIDSDLEKISHVIDSEESYDNLKIALTKEVNETEDTTSQN